MRPAFVEGVRVRFSQRKKLHFQSILSNSTGQVIKNYEYISEEAGVVLALPQIDSKGNVT